MNKALSLTALLAGPVLLASACVYEDEPKSPEPALTPAAGGVLTTWRAATHIGEARCDREARCGGPPAGPYANRGQCIAAMRDAAMKSFTGCNYGVKDRELRSCVGELRTAACGGVASSFDWLEQSIVCRAGTLCLY